MEPKNDGLFSGTCTLILAREGPQNSANDAALIEAVEADLGLPAGTLGKNDMERPEFRLIEGVSRATAERLAGLSIRYGYNPRIRDRLGIKYSNQRGAGMFVATFAATIAAWVGFTSAALLMSPWLALPLFVALMGGTMAVRRFQLQQIYMPLVVPRDPNLLELTQGAEVADVAGPVVSVVPGVSVPAEVAEGIFHAREALTVILDALEQELVPAIAQHDMISTLSTLMERVDAIEIEARGAEEAEEHWLDELLAIRRAAGAAAEAVHGDDPEQDPVARLRSAVLSTRS